MKACYYVDFKSPEDINLKYDNYLYISIDSLYKSDFPLTLNDRTKIITLITIQNYIACYRY